MQILYWSLTFFIIENLSFNWHFSLLSFSGPQLYNSEALVSMLLELADKLYNSVTVCFCASRKYVLGRKQEANVDYTTGESRKFKLCYWITLNLIIVANSFSVPGSLVCCC